MSLVLGLDKNAITDFFYLNNERSSLELQLGIVLVDALCIAKAKEHYSSGFFFCVCRFFFFFF